MKCVHIRKGLEQSWLRKMGPDHNWNFCQGCEQVKKQSESQPGEDGVEAQIWTCLKCGHRVRSINAKATGGGTVADHAVKLMNLNCSRDPWFVCPAGSCDWTWIRGHGSEMGNSETGPTLNLFSCEAPFLYVF